jgi:hypothetical protein
MALAAAGHFEMARNSVDAGVALAEQLGHPHTFAHAYVNGALTFQIVGDRAATSEACRKLIAVSEKYDFPPQLAIGRFLSGWAKAAGPNLVGGLTIMETEFELAARFVPFPNHFATMLAEVRIQAGQIDEAFQLIEQTLPKINGTDIGFYVPHLLQLRRDCLARVTWHHPLINVACWRLQPDLPNCTTANCWLSKRQYQLRSLSLPIVQLASTKARRRPGLGDAQKKLGRPFG